MWRRLAQTGHLVLTVLSWCLFYARLIGPNCDLMFLERPTLLSCSIALSRQPCRGRHKVMEIQPWTIEKAVLTTVVQLGADIICNIASDEYNMLLDHGNFTDSLEDVVGDVHLSLLPPARACSSRTSRVSSLSAGPTDAVEADINSAVYITYQSITSVQAPYFSRRSHKVRELI